MTYLSKPLLAWTLMALVASLVAEPAFARSPKIKTSFHNSIDIAGFTSCSWKQGRPALRYEVEQTIRVHVSEQIRAKGYELVDRDPDCWVMSLAAGDSSFEIGILIVEIFDRNQTLAWRGELSGLIDPAPEKVKKLVRKASKKMFKSFPKARASERN